MQIVSLIDVLKRVGTRKY